MDPIIASLRQALGPDGVLTGADARNRSGSWGLTHCDALAVLRPANTAEVSAALRICHAAGQPVVPEGGKTGLVSGARAAPGEVALSLERMRRVEPVDVPGRTLIVEAGATLQAVQDLARVASQRRLGDHDTRLRVDVGGYRERRREALGKFAVQMADEVKASGVARVLEPMSSADRKIIHDTLAEVEGIATRSEGDDPYRRVIIAPAND